MFDVGVVGAGPSGAWSAALLAQRGLRVALVDGSHPREKPCGGGLTARARAMVSGAMSSAHAGAPVNVGGVRFLTASQADGVDLALTPDGPHGANALTVCARRHLDGQLLEYAIGAGATFVSSRVTRVERDGTGFLLRCGGDAYRCRRLVGADGANSLVRRTLGRAFARSQLSIATGFYAHGVTARDIAIELVSDPPGYLWSFPRTDHLAIGICAQADAGASAEILRAGVRRWMETTGLGADGRLQPYSWPIPSLSARDIARADVGGPGWLLVGDAAGLVDPITREGILYALLSATHAADAIHAASNRPAAAMTGDDLALTTYRRLLRTHILSELGRAAELKATFFHPRFIHLTSDALRRSPAVRQVMADLLAGAQSYRGLRRRLLRTMEVGLAWRLLIDRWVRRGRWARLDSLRHPRSTRRGHVPAATHD